MARCERAPINRPLLVGEATAGVALDLSRGGIGFICPVGHAPGETLDLELAATAAAGPLRMVVEVVWCCRDRRMGHRCGARLRTIGVRDALLLKRQLDDEPGMLRAAS